MHHSCFFDKLLTTSACDMVMRVLALDLWQLFYISIWASLASKTMLFFWPPRHSHKITVRSAHTSCSHQIGIMYLLNKSQVFLGRILHPLARGDRYKNERLNCQDSSCSDCFLVEGAHGHLRSTPQNTALQVKKLSQKDIDRSKTNEVAEGVRFVVAVALDERTLEPNWLQDPPYRRD